MSPELQALYQELIIEHNKYPRNYGRLESYTHSAQGYNPLCGDEVHLTLRVEEDKIADIRFEGKSCAICRASASVMTTVVKGAAVSTAEDLFTAFHELLTQDESPRFYNLPAGAQEKLKIFSTVKNFPLRVKCASLPWHTLHAALHRIDQPVSSE